MLTQFCLYYTFVLKYMLLNTFNLTYLSENGSSFETRLLFHQCDISFFYNWKAFVSLMSFKAEVVINILKDICDYIAFLFDILLFS